MKNTKRKPIIIKDADTIIDDFTSSCDVAEASTVFTRLFVGYTTIKTTGKLLHPKDPCNQNPQDETFKKAIKAISTMLYEIEKTLTVKRL